MRRVALLILVAACDPTTAPSRVSLPTDTLTFTSPVFDAVYDVARGRVYVAAGSDPPGTSTGAIAVVQLSPPTLLQPIRMSSWPFGLDITPGGDSLVVVSVDTTGRSGFTIINLATLARDSLDSIAFTPALYRQGVQVRAMANNKAIIAITGARPGNAPGSVVEIDLATMLQTERADAGNGGAIGRSPVLGRTRDGQRLVIFSSHPDSNMVQRYNAATDSLTASATVHVPRHELPSIDGVGVSGDSAATTWLVGNELLTANLSPVRILGDSQARGVHSVLTDDGRFAYIGITDGLAKFRTSDGAELANILLPYPAQPLVISPDGNTLVAWGVGSVIMIVHLR